MSAARVALREDTDVNLAARQALSLWIVSWENIQEPGWYLDIRTREAYRFSRESLTQNRQLASPMPSVRRYSNVSAGMVQLTNNPDIGIIEVRRIAQARGYEVNF